MKKLFIIVLSINFLAIFLIGCEKDDDTSQQETPTSTINKALLYNKWWYPNDGSVISNVYYNSNGDYEQEYISVKVIGTWNWVNNSDTMFLSSIAAGDWYQVFTEISDDSMSFKMDIDNWAKKYQFDDTP